jgi:hypothetical protein
VGMAPNHEGFIRASLWWGCVTLVPPYIYIYIFFYIFFHFHRYL